RGPLLKAAGASFAGRRSRSPSWAQRRQPVSTAWSAPIATRRSAQPPTDGPSRATLVHQGRTDQGRSCGTDGEHDPDPEQVRKRDRVGTTNAPAAETVV